MATKHNIIIYMYCFNIAGLCLDILGVYMLFHRRDKGLTKIQKIPVDRTWTGIKTFQELKQSVQYLSDELIKRLNRNIDDTKNNNIKVLDKSQVPLGLILSGFLLQVTAAILGLVLVFL